jgi:hypothetical protein
MADASKELKYYERLNIPVLKISRIKKFLKNEILDTMACWKKNVAVDKLSYRIIGPAGVGKTDICNQIAKELSAELATPFELILMKAPVLTRDDFLVPFPADFKGFKGADVPTFKMLYSDLIPKMTSSFGVILIDEFSRGDHPFQQLCWQLLNEHRIHTFDLPKGWFVFTTDNPADSEYSMDTLEDAAGLRRQAHLYVDVSADDFLNYAILKKFHPLVIEYIQTHPERIYDFDAQKRGSVYANPASYEKISNVLIKMETARGGIEFEEVEAKIASLMNTHQAAMFMSFARDKKDINPKDIFFKFDTVRKVIEKLVKERDNAKLGEVMVSFCTYVMTSLPTYTDKELKNVLDFLLLMPIDTASLFISKIDTYDRDGAEFKYMTEIHKRLCKNDRYRKEFYEPMIKCGTSRSHS